VRVIFGLGNPGQRYKNNRHNVGFMILDAFAKSHNFTFRRKLLLSAAVAPLTIHKTSALLIKPLTFMNYSGLCIKKIITHYGVLRQNLLIVYDDVDLPLGCIRMRKRGSSAGHRGMASIIERLGTEDIQRLRIGIGPHPRGDVTHYVLSNFAQSEKKMLGSTIEQATSALSDWLSFGCDYVMQHYNATS
jgi:PTH1 family peptidyl-tRNA hydrolase